MKKTQTISQQSSKRFLNEIEICLPKMRDDKTFTLKDICSDQYWESLTHYERRKLGESFYEMVQSSKVLLIFLGKNKAKGNVYCLK